MTNAEASPDAGSDAAAGASDPRSAPTGDGSDYDGSGAWGTWAMVLLLTLFAIATAATVHSIVITFTR